MRVPLLAQGLPPMLLSDVDRDAVPPHVAISDDRRSESGQKTFFLVLILSANRMPVPGKDQTTCSARTIGG